MWNLISVCIKEAVEKAAVAPEQIAGVGVTSFGNGVVFLDKKDMPLRQAVFHRIIVPTVLLKCIREKEHTKRLMIL